MPAQIYYSPFIPAFSSNGAPVPGAKLFFFLTGTNTKVPIYSSESLTTALDNPVQADLSGKFPNIYLDSTVTYRVRVTDPEEVPLGGDIDPYIPGSAVSTMPNLPQLVASDGSSKVGFQQSGSTTAPRTVQSKSRETFSVLDYRFAIDANWGTSFQRAIDAVSAKGGGGLMIPDGIYEFPAVLTPAGTSICCLIMKTGVHLYGASRSGTVLKVAASQIGPGSYFRAIVSFGITQNISLRNFTFDGNRDGQGLFKEQGNGGNIVLGTVQDCDISEITSINANGQGIQVASPLPNVSARVTVTNCTVKNCSGSTLNADGTINQLYNGNGIGIQISLCSGLIVQNNIIQNCRDNGIDTYSDDGTTNPLGGGHIITGNAISGCRVGIFPETASSVLVTGNYITDCVEGGIFANRINGAPQTLRITSNMIGNVPVGIRVSGDCLPANGVMIDHNNIYSITSPSGFGIQLGLPGANVSYVDVSHNIFGVNTNVVPLIGITASQAAFIRGVDNRYFGNPDPGYFLFKSITTEVEVDIGGFIGVASSSVADLSRKWGVIRKLEVPTSAGFFGANAVGRQLVPAAATDAASTQTLVNSIRSALQALGLVG